MAEGGMDFHNPEYDKDDYDKDEAETSFTDEEQFQSMLNTQYKALDTLTGSDKETKTNSLLHMLVKRFFERNDEPVRYDEREVNYFLNQDDLGRPIFGVHDVDDDSKEYALSYYKTNKLDEIMQFYSFNTFPNISPKKVFNVTKNKRAYIHVFYQLLHFNPTVQY